MQPIEIETYAAAIARLMDLAEDTGSGSRAAAQVLLSAFNGEAWQLNITDLCLLNRETYTAALDVIRGRVELGVEPQELIPQGQDRFTNIWEQWINYHVRNRTESLF